MTVTLRLLRLAAVGAAIAVASTACSGTAGPTPTMSAAAPQAVAADPEASKPGSAAEIQAGFPTYKGNAARTGEVAGPGPSGTPATLWTVKTQGPIGSSPAVVGDVAYVVAGDKRVLALDVATGAQRWTSEDATYAGTPTVAGDRVLVIGVDGSISALGTMDGQVAWRTPSALMANSTPVVVGDLVVAGGSDRTLHAFDIRTGAKSWAAATGGNFPRSPSTDGSLVFIGGEDGVVHAFTATTGKEAWNHPTSAGHFATTAVRDGTLYASGALSDGTSELSALDAKTGEVQWRFNSPDNTGLRSPSVDETTVYIESQEHVYALERADASVRWVFDAASSEAAMTIAGDNLFLITTDETVHSLDKTTGTSRWSVKLDAGVGVGTTVADRRVIVGTDAGEVIALGASELAPATTAPTPAASSSPTPAPVTFVGELTGAPGGLSKPLDTALDSEGRIWVVESGRSGFAIFDKSGTFLERWGDAGTSNGQFNFERSKFANQPQGDIAFDKSGGFYVVDTGNFRVQHFDKARTWLANIGKFGNEDGAFLDPISIAVGPDGLVYVADDARNDVQVFNPAGEHVRTIGEPGGGPGQLSNIGSPLVVGDKLYVADYDNHRISVFTTAGKFVETIKSDPIELPQDIAVDANNRLIVADAPGRYEVIDKGAVVASWDVGLSSQNSNATGVEVLPDGRILLSGYDLGRVQIVTYP
jgi:outer membrane protein assembly factor BamB